MCSGILILASNGAEPQIKSNRVLDWLIPKAYAEKKSRAQVGQDVIKVMKPIAKSVAKNGGDPKHFTKGLKNFLKEIADPDNANWAKALTSGATLRYITALAGTKLRAFMRSSKNWRVNRWVVLMALVFLNEEQKNGKLNIPQNRWNNLVADAFSGFAWKQHGAMFQLTQVLYYHLQHRFAEGPAIITIEGFRPAYMLINGQRSKKPYGRLIDVVVSDGDGGEVWIETKSVAGKFKKAWFTQSLKAKKSDSSGSGVQLTEPRDYYRQFFHDMRMNDEFINVLNISKILPPGSASTNSEYLWYFHDFNISAETTNRPTGADIAMAQHQFCKLPKKENNTQLYKDNFAGTPNVMKAQCIAKKNNIQLRNTSSYFKDLLEVFAGDLGISDIVDIAKQIDGGI